MVALPPAPFRGIQPFRYADHAIFFAREEETRLLASLVAVHRGVLLYGDSGNGKSSLVNAGLLPQARRLGFEPVRVRVQPRTGEELVVDRIAVTDDASEGLPLVLAREDEDTSRLVLSIAEFEERVRAAAGAHRPLIVFDQFEEILTLFEDAPSERDALGQMIGRLLRDPLPVKLLFAFREDYLGRVKQLLAAHPELVDQALRLGPPSAEALEKIIRGPFERFPGRFERELDDDLARRLREALNERFGTGEVSLSEVQTVCLRLWRSQNPEALLAAKGVQGLLEDELGEALDAFSPDLRAAAIALLSEMVTSAGTRNVVSAEDLRQRVRDEDDRIPAALLDEALDRLERESRLVRRERRRDLYLYEITSEFLVPWISRRREELQRAQDRRREHRRLRILGAIAVALLLLVGLMAGIAVWSLDQRSAAQREASEATSLALATSSVEPLSSRPDVSLALAFEAYRTRPRPEANAAVVRGLLAAREARARGVLTDANSLGAAVFSPDGGRVAAIYGSGATTTGFVPADYTVRVWDLATGVRRRLVGHKGPLYAVAFSPDGKVLGSAGPGEIRVWNPADGRSLARLPLPEIAQAIGFGPGGKTLLSADGDGSVRVWDLGTQKQIRQVPQPRGWRSASRTLAFNADGTAVATVGDETASGPVTVRDLATGRQARLRGLEGSVDFATFSQDGATLVASNFDGKIGVWRTASGDRVSRFSTGFGLESVALSPNGRTLASAGGSIRLWSTEGKPLARLTRDGARSVAFSPDGSTVAASDGGDAIRLLDARAGRPDRLRNSTGVVDAVAYSPRGSLLAAAGGDAAALWDPGTGLRRGRRPKAAVEPVADVAFSRDGRLLAEASLDATIRISTPSRPGAAVVLRGRDPVVAVAFAPDGKTLAAATSVAPGSVPTAGDNRVRLWDVATRRQIARLDDGSQAVAFSPDGKVLASGSLDQTVHLWSTATHRQLRRPLRGHGGAVTSVAFSPDGRLLASSGADGAILLWDPSSGRRLGRLGGHAGSVRAVAMSPNGETLASAGDDGTVRLWQLETGRQIALLRLSDAIDVAFSPDGRTLAGAGRESGVRLWREILWRSTSELRASVCDTLLTGLSRADWNRYAPGIPYRRTCP